MQKSMVQELSSLTYSTVFTTRPSFISTHITDPDVNQLRKSRISNLPGYRKQDLSAKLNFVVVFQGIEIERLSREIQMLRVRARDWERQLHNYESYQVQIRQLTERCHMYQLQKEGMQEQSQKMKIFCQQLYRQFQEYKAKYSEADAGLKEKYGLQKKRSEQLKIEIQKWRNRFTSLQRSKSKELEQMRLQFQAQRKSFINREIKQITIKYQNELGNITSELRKVREESEFKVSEIHRLNHLIQGYQLKEQQMADIQVKMEEYQNKFVMLSQENYRLNQLLRWKGQQLQKLRTSQQSLKNQLDGSKMLQVSNQKLTVDIQKLSKEIHQHKVANSRASQLIQKLQIQNKKINDYQKLSDKSNAQIQRLNNIIHIKINELDQHKSNVNILQTKLNAVNNASQKQFASYQQKMVNYNKEQQKLNMQLKNRLSQNQSLKTKITQMDRKIQNFKDIRMENKQLKEKLGSSVQQMEEFKMKISLLEENVSIMSSLEETLNRDQAIKAQLIAERERLNQTIRSLTLQLQTSNQKLSAMETQCSKYENIKVQIREYQSRMAFMTQQLDKINAQIQLRVGQLNQLRQSLKSLTNGKNIYQSIQQKLVENMSQMEKLILDLNDSRRDNQRLQEVNMNLQMSNKKMQGDIIAINQERVQLNRIVDDKTTEVSRLSQQLDSLSTVVTEHRMYQRKNQQYQSQLQTMKSNYSQLQSRYQRQIKKSQEYSNQVEQMCVQLMQLRQQPTMSAKLSEEIVSIRQECTQKTMMISVLTRRIQTIEGILKSVKQRYAMQCHYGEQMRRKLESVNAKMVVFDKVLQMANTYAEELNKVSEQNIMLQSQTRVLDIQMCESVKVVEDQEQMQKKTQHLLNTFGFPQVNIKNQSIANQISSNDAFQIKEGHTFTFKQVINNNSSNNNSSNNNNNNNQVNFNRPPSSVDQNRQRQRDEQQINSLAQAREVTSVRHSIINNLVQKDSGRYQNVGVSQYQSINNPNFGNGITVSKMKYISSNSPSRPSNSVIVSPSSPTHRNNEVRYVAIDSQLQNDPYGVSNRGYVNPFQQQTRQNHSAFLQNAGVKRVTSYTSFTNHPQSPIHHPTTSITPMASHGHHHQNYFHAQDVPRIRVLQAAQSPNIANSTRSTSVHQAKPTRPISEIPRWSNLRPHQN